jgi:tellurite resistance protein
MTAQTALPSAATMLEMEARALLTRLARIKPLALLETTVAAAALSPSAQSGIDRFLLAGRREVGQQVKAFIAWLQTPAGRAASPVEMQRRFILLRLRFNSTLTQLDIFADAVTQRSENETGVWLSGLDVVAADALNLPGNYYQPPPVICYLDRGHGAAIRRARTRLPGGGENPVAVIRVPRERMIGCGIASSLIHEVGHQAAALLDLVESIRPELHLLQQERPGEQVAWRYWERCISEILADFWSVAKVGLTSTLGLIGVVALPGYFVFRLSLNDPHPVPWIRVKLSGLIGRELYPHPQWQWLNGLWDSFYPLNVGDGLDEEKRRLLLLLEKTAPALAKLIADHQPKALNGASLREALRISERRPEQLQDFFKAWRASPALMQRASPVMVFAVIGQARAEGVLSPEQESRILTRMLNFWALRSALDTSTNCAALPIKEARRGAAQTTENSFNQWRPYAR